MKHIFKHIWKSFGFVVCVLELRLEQYLSFSLHVKFVGIMRVCGSAKELFRKLSLSCACLKVIPNSTRLNMGELPPDRRTKRMPQPVQSHFPLAAHSSRIALHCVGSNAAY